MSEHGEWTINTLREYIEARLTDMELRYDERFTAQKDAITAALNSSEKAVLKAENAYEKRFENVNEFRSSLADQQRTFMPRLEAETHWKALNEKLDAIENRVNRSEGRGGGQSQMFAWALAALMALLAIAGWMRANP